MTGTVTPGLQSVSHYDLVEKIAEGGMGTVYRGRDQLTGKTVAVKVVPKHLLSNAVFLKRFEQEYNAAKQLDHPNIVRAMDFGREGETPFLVMEFVEGESLGAKLEREGALDESTAIRIISQVAEGLHKAHKLGLIHRDVKPDNVLITKAGLVKLTDLGLVKELEGDNNLTRTGRGLGTPHFMAPEQFRNAKKADVRCDIYSLAATLYMMVTGELPFKSLNPLDAWMKKINNELPPPRKVRPEISERIDWAISKSMSADPNLRAASCRDFIDDLTGADTHRGALDGSVSTTMDWWYMVYKDEDGVIHTVKGTMQGIRRSLKEHLLGNATGIRVSRGKKGPFESLRAHPEFGDLATEPEDMPATQETPSPWASGDRPPPQPEPQEAHEPEHGSLAGYLPPVLPRAESQPDGGATNPLFLDMEALSGNRRSDGKKFLMLMLFGIGLGILGYVLFTRHLHLRLF
jgi:eukaryotic-like serine/threonine-protein kinase